MDKKTTWAEPYHQVVALASTVLVVCAPGEAGEGPERDWAAYIGSVPGVRHHSEWREVARSGEKLPRRVACAIFPSFNPAKYRD